MSGPASGNIIFVRLDGVEDDMALRMVEIFAPSEEMERIGQVLEEHRASDSWHDRLSEGRVLIRVFLPAERTEALLDVLGKRFATVEGFRVVLLPVVASLPRPAEAAGEDERERVDEEDAARPSLRVSREELYTAITDAVRLSRVYIVLVALSAVVAAVGILRDNVAVIIGAMVIAPLLGPNVGLSLATALGDMRLARRALKTKAVGALTAFAPALGVGAFCGVNAHAKEVLSRTEVGPAEFALALAAGVAGALAFTTGASAALIGVMVAAALLPPLVTSGLLLGAAFVGGGQWRLAFGAFLLFAANFICLNLAGVTTFLLQGIHPSSWWEAARARRAARLAILLWAALLAALALVTSLARAG